MARKPLGDALKSRGSGATTLRIVNPGNVGDLISAAVDGTAAADVPLAEGEWSIVKPEEVTATAALSKAWDDLYPIFVKNGILHQPDVVILEMMLRHLVAFRDASDELMLMGPVVDGVLGGEVKNPADTVMRSQSAMLMACLKEMGLTLVSRAKQPSSGDPTTGKTDDANPYAATGS